MLISSCSDIELSAWAALDVPKKLDLNQVRDTDIF
jgi:hypothetical protein